MIDRRGPRTAWLVSIGVLLALALAAAVLVPRLNGPVPPSAAADPPRRSATAGPATSSPSPASGPIRVLGFGDSVMAGTGCDCDDFLTQAGRQLQKATGRTVTTVNNGANGQTAAGTLRDLRTDDAYPVEIARADVIVLIIGANDLGPALDSYDDEGCTPGCYQPAVTEMSQQLAGVLTLIDTEKRPDATVLVMNYWNVFEDGDVGRGDYGAAYLGWSDTVTKAANAAICRAAAAHQAICVDTYAPFKGDGTDDPTELLAEDGDHPNAAGTVLLADAVRAAILTAWSTR